MAANVSAQTFPGFNIRHWAFFSCLSLPKSRLYMRQTLQQLSYWGKVNANILGYLLAYWNSTLSKCGVFWRNLFGNFLFKIQFVTHIVSTYKQYSGGLSVIKICLAPKNFKWRHQNISELKYNAFKSLLTFHRLVYTIAMLRSLKLYYTCLTHRSHSNVHKNYFSQ